MDVCIYSTLMVELLQLSRMMSDLEFIITIGVMQLITTSELPSVANCFMIPILCSKCMRTACVTRRFPAGTSSVGFLPPGQARIPFLQQLLSADAKVFQIADTATFGIQFRYQQMILKSPISDYFLFGQQPMPIPDLSC